MFALLLWRATLRGRASAQRSGSGKARRFFLVDAPAYSELVAATQPLNCYVLLKSPSTACQTLLEQFMIWPGDTLCVFKLCDTKISYFASSTCCICVIGVEGKGHLRAAGQNTPG
jgi:hypothetical protein